MDNSWSNFTSLATYSKEFCRSEKCGDSSMDEILLGVLDFDNAASSTSKGGGSVFAPPQITTKFGKEV